MLSHDEFLEWVTVFTIEHEEMKKQQKDAKSKSPKNSRSMRGRKTKK